ncbi:hypothetical protein Q31b_17420 [Novipirellula aureliae]|uniref:Uncharacterized protein n=1 Tax=Novipirellula aureliae TaxID=2527966 RepID=A0A5C6E9Q9_9BACT|nr:hypothetical protein [Novipirellula aureliae]TWU44206.1 hypothetical protein Q31b_17420 [Novipirellula aureliae]
MQEQIRTYRALEMSALHRTTIVLFILYSAQLNATTVSLAADIHGADGRFRNLEAARNVMRQLSRETRTEQPTEVGIQTGIDRLEILPSRQGSEFSETGLNRVLSSRESRQDFRRLDVLLTVD